MTDKRARNEIIKENSRQLRGTIAQGLDEVVTGAIAEADQHANGTLRATTRQTFQLHGVIKSNMRRTMQAIEAAMLDTLAACGDVNRNVLATGNPYMSKVHAATHQLAVDISQHLLPWTGAYHEIW